MTEFYVCVEFAGLTMEDADTLYDKGFDDGLIHGRANRIFIDLDIEANSFDEAALIAAKRCQAANFDVVAIFPGEEEPPHNSEAIIRHYKENVEKYVRATIGGARLFLNRRS